MTDADVTEPASQHSDAEAPVPYRSGFVAVVGRPNVGRSTLINALIGTQIAIASSRPETTRKAIRGILTTDNAQIVLVDTPGIHRPRTLLGQRLNDVVDESLSDVDAIAFLLPADQEIGPGDKRILSRLRSDFAVKRDDGTFKWKVPLIAIVTKIDELDRSALIDKLIEINEFPRARQSRRSTQRAGGEHARRTADVSGRANHRRTSGRHHRRTDSRRVPGGIG